MITATPSERQLRNLHDQITYAARKLAQARQDGNYKQIQFWTDRENQLLERWPNTKQPNWKPPA